MRRLWFAIALGIVVACSRHEHPPLVRMNGGSVPNAGGGAAGGSVASDEAGAANGGVAGSVAGGDGGTGAGSAAAGAAGDISGLGGAGAGVGGRDGDGGIADDAGSMAGAIVKVMSFNIRYDTAEDGDDAWLVRKPLTYEVFTRQQADLIGVQEALENQLVDIDANVAGYSRIGVGRNDGEQSGEFSAIYYRSERFEVESSGTFWFSDTPEVPGSTSWGNTIPRICTWGHFTDLETGQGIYHFNVHLDHQSQPSRELSVALLMQRAAERPMAAEPVIVTGDFNADEQNVAILFMKGEAMVDGAHNPLPMVDSFRALYPDETQVRTGHSFNGGVEGPKIDFIFMGPGQTALAAEIDHANTDGRYPSDHYPVTATLQLPAVQ